MQSWSACSPACWQVRLALPDRHVLHIAGPLLRDHRELVITVNIVAADLSDPNFCAVLEQTFDASGIAREQIGLELTERPGLISLSLRLPGCAHCAIRCISMILARATRVGRISKT
jgi:hypothetical protein